MDNERYRRKIFKILPLFEGKIKDEDMYLPIETAYEQYQDYLSILAIEFSAIEEEPFVEILNCIKGLKKLEKKATHSQVKRIVFYCTSLLKRE